jgi:hypothetical protein
MTLARIGVVCYERGDDYHGVNDTQEQLSDISEETLTKLAEDRIAAFVIERNCKDASFFINLMEEVPEKKIRGGGIYDTRNTPHYMSGLKVCANCGWLSGGGTTAYDGQFFCRQDECQEYARQATNSKLSDELKEHQSNGLCSFNIYYVGNCSNPIASADVVFCTEHLGVKCVVCDKQAVRENGEAGSLVYTWPVCEDHLSYNRR